MPSEDYRCYRLDSAGDLHDAEWFEAAGDEDAIAQIRDKYPDAKCEIWQRQRLVAVTAPMRLRA